MSDIVERLRKQAWQRSGAPKMDAGHAKMLEWLAADELERLRADIEKLKDPNVVHLGMLSGGIAKPNWKQIEHLYPEEIEQLRGQVERLTADLNLALREIADLKMPVTSTERHDG